MDVICDATYFFEKLQEVLTMIPDTADGDRPLVMSKLVLRGHNMVLSMAARSTRRTNIAAQFKISKSTLYELVHEAEVASGVRQ